MYVRVGPTAGVFIALATLGHAVSNDKTQTVYMATVLTSSRRLCMSRIFTCTPREVSRTPMLP